jgi:predicted PurR-regulated permease PerM
MTSTTHDLTRNVLAVLALSLLIAFSGLILSPFLAAIVWATMIVVATWRPMLIVERICWGKRWIAVTAMTLGLLLVLIVPLSAAIIAIVDHADGIVGWVRTIAKDGLPLPPDWVAGVPLVGERVDAGWRELASGDTGLLARITPYLGAVTKWLAAQFGNIGLVAVQFLLTVAIAGIMYACGETGADGVRRFMRRLAGERGDVVVTLAAQAIRGVALGVVVTAFVQSVLGGIGLVVAGVPLAAILTAVMFMSCVAQIGPVIILAPAVGWLYWTGSTGWGTALLVWTVFVGTIDNYLRPYLIRRGADLPLLLIFAGVIGGLISLGPLGIFVGPVVLAVAYRLVNAWVDEKHPPQEESTEA